MLSSPCSSSSSAIAIGVGEFTRLFKSRLVEAQGEYCEFSGSGSGRAKDRSVVKG